MRSRRNEYVGPAGWSAFAVIAATVMPTRAGGQEAPVLTVDQLVCMSRAELDQLYLSGQPAGVPCGKVRGRAIVAPGSRFAPTLSAGARVMWQGKVFCPDDAMAVNRFFGVRAVKGRLYYAESWMDGAPALILDYEDTSFIYRRYRDEIRQVAPGVLLGAMYSRTCPPTFKMYFALETCQ
jgi:hypothetical protein